MLNSFARREHELCKLAVEARPAANCVLLVQGMHLAESWVKAGYDYPFLSAARRLKNPQRRNFNQRSQS